MFFLVNMLYSIFSPTISYALTAGPSAPEFSSFEPVDTTDMVNLATGDLVYNLPLLEVPGPEGGYPLSLSYHAGIKPQQESSWIGLGWTLNPGAVTRNVDNFPDDNYENKRVIRDYWDGGESTSKSYSVGLSMPGGGQGSTNYTQVKTQDTYKGFSTSAYSSFSSSSRIFDNNPLSMASPSMGYNLGSNSASGHIAGSVFSPASNNGNPSGISSITISNDIFNIGGRFLNFGVSETFHRYWQDQSESILSVGALYPEKANSLIGQDGYINQEPFNNQLTSYTFDTYDAYDHNPLFPEETVDPSEQLGGTYPAYDTYSVTGQGIGGVMQPVILEHGNMNGQNVYERNYYTGQPDLNLPIREYIGTQRFSKQKVDFRFLGDFSNTVELDPGKFERTGNPFIVAERNLTVPSDGFDDEAENQHLAGSKHVEWFTNEEIENGTASSLGFMDYYQGAESRRLSYEVYENYLQPEMALPFTCESFGNDISGDGSGMYITDNYQDTDPFQACAGTPQYKSLKPKTVPLDKKIGGFMITNASGVTYHYALPVYGYNEYSRSQLKEPKEGRATIKEVKNDEPYAYTWLLTAITGPDYVDKGGAGNEGDGMLNDQDWGYWVKFDYGLWTDSYQWRTPHSGYASDIGSDWETFSYGVKELYYLDAIETRTYKALFVKSKKKDGRGVTSRLEGGSKPRKYTLKWNSNSQTELGSLTYSVSPVSTMKLDEIYLIKKSELENINLDKQSGDAYQEAPIEDPHPFPYVGSEYLMYEGRQIDNRVTIRQGEDFVKVKYHNGHKVLDRYDLENGVKDQLTNKSLKIIRFDNDHYDLADGTPNSIGYYSDFSSVLCPDGIEREYPSQIPCGVPIGGSVCTVAQDGSRLFDFYSEDPLFGQSNLNNCTLVEGFLGEELVYRNLGKLTLKGVKSLGKAGVDIMPPTQFSYHVNPGYSAEDYDLWQFYKSDFNGQDESHTRRATLESAANKNAWSLKSVKTAMGAKIKFTYESDDFIRASENNYVVLAIDKIERTSALNNSKIYFKEKGLSNDQYFQIGDQIDLTSLVADRGHIFDGFRKDHPMANILESPANVIIEDVREEYILVNNAALYEQLGNRTATFTQLPGETFDVIPHFMTGFVKVDVPAARYGDGLRVKDITIIDTFSGQTTKNIYDYTDPETGISSGVTSYEPFIQTSFEFPEDDPVFEPELIPEGQEDAKDRITKALKNIRIEFQKVINKPFGRILALNRELPPPGVIYEYVTKRMETNGEPYPGYEVNQFRVYNQNMVTEDWSPCLAHDCGTNKVINKAFGIGNLISQSLYGKQDRLLQKSTNDYLLDEQVSTHETDIADKDQGVVKQGFYKRFILKEYDFDPDENGGTLEQLSSKERAIISVREEYPDVLTATTIYDAKTGIRVTTKNLDYDLYTGQVTKSLTADSYGNHFVVENLPAYKVEAYSGMTGAQIQSGMLGMGLKVKNLENKHMLTQSAATYQYKVDNDNWNNREALSSAEVQTWSDEITTLETSIDEQRGKWRKHRTYNWQSPQLTNEGMAPLLEPSDEFNYSVDTQNPSWVKLNEVTLYTVFSKAIESKDINGYTSAVRLSPDNTHVAASVTNASYQEFYYDGLENWEGNVPQSDGVVSFAGQAVQSVAHTGTNSLLTDTQGEVGFKLDIPGNSGLRHGKYRVSVWLHESNAESARLRIMYNNSPSTVVYVPFNASKKAGAWYLMQVDVDFNEGEPVSVSCFNQSATTLYWDDFRFHPLDAQMTSYVHNEWDEVSHILDANNMYTRYHFDAIGRLEGTYVESFSYGEVHTNEYRYHYAEK